MTMAAESAPPEQMATAIGWVQTAQRLGPALGPGDRRRCSRPASGCARRSSSRRCVYLGAFLLVIVGYREEGLRAPAASGGAASPPTFAAHPRASRTSCCSSASIFGLQLVDRSFGPVLPLYLRRDRHAAGPRAVPERRRCSRSRRGAAALGNQLAGWLLTRWRPSQVVVPAVAAASLWRGRLRRSAPPTRCSSRPPWSSASASASRRRRSTRRRGEARRRRIAASRSGT